MAVDLSEFASTLKQQGTTLCLPLGRTLGLALSRFGFQPGQEVVVRFAHEKLEVLPRGSSREVRRKLTRAAEELRAFAEGMRTLLQELPEVPDDEPEKADTWEAEVLGMLECLLADDLLPAIEKLESVESWGPEPAPRPKARRKAGGAATERVNRGR